MKELLDILQVALQCLSSADQSQFLHIVVTSTAVEPNG